MGFLGFGVLPVDTVGLVLIGFGLALIGVEIFFTSGIFGIAGGVVVAIGGFIAFRDTPSDLRPPWWLGVGFGLALLIFFVGMNYLTARVRKNQARDTGSRYIGQFAIATTDLGPLGNVRIQGERWNAQLLGTDRAAAGEKLRVVRRRPHDPPRPQRRAKAASGVNSPLPAIAGRGDTRAMG